MRNPQNSLLQSILFVIDLTKSPESTFSKFQTFEFQDCDIHIFYIGDKARWHPSWKNWAIPYDNENKKSKSRTRYKKSDDQMCAKFLGHNPVTIWNGKINGRVGDRVLQILCTRNFDILVIPSCLKRQDEYFKNDQVPVFGSSPIPLMTI